MQIRIRRDNKTWEYLVECGEPNGAWVLRRICDTAWGARFYAWRLRRLASLQPWQRTTVIAEWP